MLMRLPSSVDHAQRVGAAFHGRAGNGDVVTFGVSLTIILLSVSLRRRVIARLNATGSVPTLIPGGHVRQLTF